MAKREKIMLLLMVVALVFGSYFLLFAPAQMDETSSARDDSEELNRFVMQAAKQLYRKNEVTTALYIIDHARTPWVRDPFITIKAPEPVKPEVVPSPKNVLPDVTFSYTGYLDVGGMRLAIINGQEYATQDVIGPEGHVLTHISPQQVIIQSSRQKTRLVVPLEETRVLTAEPPTP